MNNKIVFLSLLLLNSGMTQAEYSYSDGIKIQECIGKNVSQNMVNYIISRNDSQQSRYVNTMAPFLVFCHNFVPGDKLEKVNRYNAWYAYNPACFDSAKEMAITQLVEPVVLLGADYALEKLTDAVSRTEKGKATIQAIPAHHHAFIAKNGKFIFASAGARLVGGAADNECFSRGAKTFGKQVTLQLTAEAMETYVINPQIDQWMGVEDSIVKSSAKFITNTLVQIATVQAIQKVAS